MIISQSFHTEEITRSARFSWIPKKHCVSVGYTIEEGRAFTVARDFVVKMSFEVSQAKPSKAFMWRKSEIGVRMKPYKPETTASPFLENDLFL